ncbi:hypothetical protein LX32DRAFT_643060 [Colletotrichum zoysiae]|uniref:Uncharacterized protein n=1 Tax=Colletotrichum zoysiae TaxID=1216348 RepID=A0AAD9LXS7_9PEZI|nr:hypothetical protein LX32DRAFT_643060 [Colletotrichum zoysiae]
MLPILALLLHASALTQVLIFIFPGLRGVGSRKRTSASSPVSPCPAPFVKRLAAEYEVSIHARGKRLPTVAPVYVRSTQSVMRRDGVRSTRPGKDSRLQTPDFEWPVSRSQNDSS